MLTAWYQGNQFYSVVHANAQYWFLYALSIPGTKSSNEIKGEYNKTVCQIIGHRAFYKYVHIFISTLKCNFSYMDGIYINNAHEFHTSDIYFCTFFRLQIKVLGSNNTYFTNIYPNLVLKSCLIPWSDSKALLKLCN